MDFCIEYNRTVNPFLCLFLGGRVLPVGQKSTLKTEWSGEFFALSSMRFEDLPLLSIVKSFSYTCSMRYALRPSVFNLIMSLKLHNFPDY
jgi:hypothetical protein